MGQEKAGYPSNDRPGEREGGRTEGAGNHGLFVKYDLSIYLAVINNIQSLDTISWGDVTRQSINVSISYPHIVTVGGGGLKELEE